MRGRSDVPTLYELAELAEMVRSTPGLYVRYSEGPRHDAEQRSIDTESGLELPGLSVNPLDPESWWTRPLEDWLARQLCQYRHLAQKNPNRFAWVLSGTLVARGPDCEPLLRDVSAIAHLDPELLTRAERRYRSRFEAEQGPEH